jgi:hypothetical protein
MNVEIGAEAVLFPEKEYINGIAVAVQPTGGDKALFRGSPGVAQPPLGRR